MTAKYDKLGLEFLYPENWKLIDDVSGSPQVITLETPDGSTTWSVHLYPLETDIDSVLREAIDSLQQTYDFTPVILTQVITENELDAVTGRINNIANSN